MQRLRLQHLRAFVLVPLFYAPVVYIFLVTLVIGMAVSAGYEVVEWVSDTLPGDALRGILDGDSALRRRWLDRPASRHE